MKCPYCNSKMETGVLEGQRYLLWAKQPHKLSYRPKAGEVLLGEKAVSSARVDSYICKQCKKIIIDYANLDGVKEG
jgi:DNA-directed RNA polymerase subunit RPC12/RpoP